MRMDTLAEKCIALLEERLIKLIGSTASLFIVSASAACTFLTILYWAEEQDAKAEMQSAVAAQRAPSYILGESPVDGSTSRGEFSYAIVGSSECIRMTRRGSLSQNLNAELAKQDRFRVRAYDFCHAGSAPDYKYRAVVAASYLDIDLIIVTHTLRDAFSLFEKKKALKLSDVSGFGSAIVFAHPTSPLVVVERFLSGWFSSYYNRFEHSLAPIFAPYRFEVVKADFADANEEGTRDRHTDVLLTGSAPSDAIDSRILSKLRSKPSAHPGEAFELIASAAIENNIPLLFVIFPSIERSFPSRMESVMNPITLKLADASANRIAREFSEADEYLNENYANVRIWQAYREDIALPDDFLDPAHFANYDWIVKRLVEVIDEEGFLPHEQ